MVSSEVRGKCILRKEKWPGLESIRLGGDDTDPAVAGGPFAMQGFPFFSFLPILLLLVLPKRVHGCNNRVIVLKPKLDGNGNWVLTKEKCRSCQDSRDDSNGTMPPTPPPDGTTPALITPIPIGDCECGQGITMEKVVGEGGWGQMNRPWMVHFR